jgi:hypothetical protein
MASLYPNLSDEQLLERLRHQARAEECELVEERRGDEWHVAFRTGPQPLARGGVVKRAADSVDRREARESLLYSAEQRL